MILPNLFTQDNDTLTTAFDNIWIRATCQNVSGARGKQFLKKGMTWKQNLG